MTTQNRYHFLAIRTAGLACFSAGLLGAALGVYKVFVNPSVPETQWSYPLDSAAFTVVQVWFALQHVALLLGLMALQRTGALGRGRLARIGHPVAVVSMAGFAVTELAAIVAAASRNASPAAKRRNPKLKKVR